MSVNKGDVSEANASHAQEVLEREWQEEFEKDAAPYGYPIERSSCNCGYCFYKDDDTNERFLGFLAAKQSSQAALAEKDRKIAELEMRVKIQIKPESQFKLIAELEELTRQATELQSRLDKWEKWVPADGSLVALKEQAEDSSLAAKTAYINGLEFHLKHADRQNTELVKLLAVMRGLLEELQNFFPIGSAAQQAIVKALSATSEVVEQYLDEVRAEVWDSASEAWNLCTCCWSAEQVAAIEEISDECLKKADELRAKKGGE